MRGLVHALALISLGLTTVTEGRHAEETQLVLLDVDATLDLPCPWCGAPTAEDDEECPGCRQQFG